MKWLTPSTASRKSPKVVVAEPARRIVVDQIRDRRRIDEQRDRHSPSASHTSSCSPAGAPAPARRAVAADHEVAIATPVSTRYSASRPR